MAVVGVDQTVYSDGKVPELALRNLFQQEAIEPPLRKAIADAGFVTTNKFAMLGKDQEDFEKKAKLMSRENLAITSLPSMPTWPSWAWCGSHASGSWNSLPRSVRACRRILQKSSKSPCPTTTI